MLILPRAPIADTWAMLEILAGLVVAFAIGLPHAWAERRGNLALYVAASVLLVAGVLALFLLGDRLLLHTDSPLLIAAYLGGVLGVRRLANEWWGRTPFWRRP